MSEPPPRTSAAGAGMMLLVTIVVCAGVGFGVGEALGSSALGAVAGGFIGLMAGFALVYTRFKNI